MYVSSLWLLVPASSYISQVASPDLSHPLISNRCDQLLLSSPFSILMASPLVSAVAQQVPPIGFTIALYFIVHSPNCQKAFESCPNPQNHLNTNMGESQLTLFLVRCAEYSNRPSPLRFCTSETKPFCAASRAANLCLPPAYDPTWYIIVSPYRVVFSASSNVILARACRDMSSIIFVF